jgi:uroporphyrinogen decarboxylase
MKTKRTQSCLAKLKRMDLALHHKEPDRVPISDSFWGGFVKRWQEELHLPQDASPLYYYDLDWVATIPNMDPHIKSFETIKEDKEEVILKTGFETTLRKRFDMPMPEQMSWDADTIEKLEAFKFDDAADKRRFFSAGDNQIAGVGDGFARNSPAWMETVEVLRKDFPVYGSMLEASEFLTRAIGQMNALMWFGEYPERMGEQVKRINAFYCRCAEASIIAARGQLDGFVIWGDVAYRNNLFVSPTYWRTWFKPGVKAIIDMCHKHSLPVIYHGCGNVKAILPDFIEMGLDAYNPLEAKAGLDAVELRKEYGHKLAFCGNNDVTIWEAGNPEKVRRETLHKLNAAKGGGYIFQSDHSVSSGVSGKTYDMIVKLVRKYGEYPLQLGEFDE